MAPSDALFRNTGKLSVRNERWVKSPIVLLGQVWYCLISASADRLWRNDTHFKPVVTHKQHSTYQQEQTWDLTHSITQTGFSKPYLRVSHKLFMRQILCSAWNMTYFKSWAEMKKTFNSIHSESLQIRSVMKVQWDFHMNRVKKLRMNNIRPRCKPVAPVFLLYFPKLPVLHLSLLAFLRKIFEMNLRCYILKWV